MRPVCKTEGCVKGCQNTATTANPQWRKYCATCHKKRMKNFREKRDNLTLDNTPHCVIKNCHTHVTLIGTDHEGQLKFSMYCEKHGGTPFHLQWRKTYCEHIDERLGFKCTTTIVYNPPLPEGIEWCVDYGYPQPMLQVDHIDGNPYNEPEDGSNFQTLCACCHLYKTWQSGDNKTAGRKTLKMPKVVLE